MKIKIEIKGRWASEILFKFSLNNNTIKKTLVEAVKRGAYLTGIKIKKATVLTGLYKYVVIPFISEKDVPYIVMGCYTRT